MGNTVNSQGWLASSEENSEVKTYSYKKNKIVFTLNSATKALTLVTCLKPEVLQETQPLIRKANLGEIRSLVVSCSLPSFPLAFVVFNDITSLDLSYTEISLYPPVLAFNSLKSLNLTRCKLNDVPNFVRGLFTLESIYLGRNYLTQLPAFFAKLTKLKFIDLSSSKITSLEIISQLPSIEQIVLSNCPKMKFENLQFANLQLQFVDLSHCSLSKLPGARSIQVHLKKKPEVAEISDFIGDIKKLEELLLAERKSQNVEALSPLKDMQVVDLAEDNQEIVESSSGGNGIRDKSGDLKKPPNNKYKVILVHDSLKDVPLADLRDHVISCAKYGATRHTTSSNNNNITNSGKINISNNNNSISISGGKAGRANSNSLGSNDKPLSKSGNNNIVTINNNNNINSNSNSVSNSLDYNSSSSSRDKVLNVDFDKDSVLFVRETAETGKQLHDHVTSICAKVPKCLYSLLATVYTNCSSSNTNTSTSTTSTTSTISSSSGGLSSLVGNSPNSPVTSSIAIASFASAFAASNSSNSTNSANASPTLTGKHTRKLQQQQQQQQQQQESNPNDNKQNTIKKSTLEFLYSGAFRICDITQRFSFAGFKEMYDVGFKNGELLFQRTMLFGKNNNREFLFTEESTEKFWKVFGWNKTSQISFSEFLSIISFHYSSSIIDTAVVEFLLLDWDGDGTISLDDLDKWWGILEHRKSWEKIFATFSTDGYTLTDYVSGLLSIVNNTDTAPPLTSSGGGGVGVSGGLGNSSGNSTLSSSSNNTPILKRKNMDQSLAVPSNTVFFAGRYLSGALKMLFEGGIKNASEKIDNKGDYED